MTHGIVGKYVDIALDHFSTLQTKLQRHYHPFNKSEFHQIQPCLLWLSAPPCGLIPLTPPSLRSRALSRGPYHHRVQQLIKCNNIRTNGDHIKMGNRCGIYVIWFIYCYFTFLLINSIEIINKSIFRKGMCYQNHTLSSLAENHMNFVITLWTIHH